MKPRSLADFMFTGVAIIPGILIWLDQVGLALSAFIALLIAACLCGWQEQVDGAGSQAADLDAAPANPREQQSRDSPLHRTDVTPDRDEPGMRQ